LCHDRLKDFMSSSCTFDLYLSASAEVVGICKYRWLELSYHAVQSHSAITFYDLNKIEKNLK